LTSAPGSLADEGREPAPAPTVEQVSDGVYAYVQLDGQWGLNNCAFVVGSTAVTLVDTCYTERRTRALLNAIGGVTDRPISTLINTHEHGDHTWGNFMLPATTTIIGHERCGEGMLAAGFGAQAIFPGVEWGNIELRTPTVTFRDRLTLWVDELEIQGWHVGPAHSTSDVVLWLPARKVLLAADVVFNGGTPFVLFGSVSGSLAALEQLERLGAEVVVPGHGAVGGPETLGRQAAYLRFVQRIAAEAVAAGVSPLEAALQTDLGDFSQLHDPERLVGNLFRAMAEHQGAEPGAPIDYGAALEGMVQFNGGRPLHCMA
jgi:cyclase